MVDKKQKEEKIIPVKEEKVILPKEPAKPLYDFLLADEDVLYKKGFLILTNKRLIKHGTDWQSKFFNLFNDEFQDIYYKDLISVQKVSKINTKYFSASIFFLSIMCLALIINSVPIIGPYAQKINQDPGSVMIACVFLSVLCLIIPFFTKIRVLRIYGNGAKIDFHHFEDEDVKTVRSYQQKILFKTEK